MDTGIGANDDDKPIGAMIVGGDELRVLILLSSITTELDVAVASLLAGRKALCMFSMPHIDKMISMGIKPGDFKTFRLFS